MIGWLVPPLGMAPVSNAPPSAVAVCVIASVFFQATVWPAWTAIVLGEKDMPAMVMTTFAVALGLGVEVAPVAPVGIVVVPFPPPPPQLAVSQPAASTARLPASVLDIV
jgi:hypothetical protein